jgi:hypothetical protein
MQSYNPWRVRRIKMKWKMVQKGNVWKRKLEFEKEDWVCITVITGVIVIMFLGAIIRSM